MPSAPPYAPSPIAVVDAYINGTTSVATLVTKVGPKMVFRRKKAEKFRVRMPHPLTLVASSDPSPNARDFWTAYFIVRGKFCKRRKDLPNGAWFALDPRPNAMLAALTLTRREVKRSPLSDGNSGLLWNSWNKSSAGTTIPLEAFSTASSKNTTAPSGRMTGSTPSTIGGNIPAALNSRCSSSSTNFFVTLRPFAPRPWGTTTSENGSAFCSTASIAPPPRE